MSTNKIVPFSLKDAPSLIEKLLPVQKLSAESYKEQMAGSGKTLTALGSYWKGRKPLILNKACILGCLLPATDDPKRDLEIFEMLMAMDDESFVARWKRRYRPKEILEKLPLDNVRDLFTSEPEGVLPESSPINWSEDEYEGVRVQWRDEVSELSRRRIEKRLLPATVYRERVHVALRPEEVGEEVHEHIWSFVNSHLGTTAASFPELTEQLGVMRFGNRPRFADTFSGSGQIPFEALRLGCDVHASDLNPIACILSWAALNVVGGNLESRDRLVHNQQKLIREVQRIIDDLGIEIDGDGWTAKAFLYCLEVRCPQSGWLVPLLPSRVVSRGKKAVARLVPDFASKRYDIEIVSNVEDDELNAAAIGTVHSGGRGQESFMVHCPENLEYRTKIPTIRGDYRTTDGEKGNKLRQWAKEDFQPRSDDIFQERLYAIFWMKRKSSGKRYDFEFRGIGNDDIQREQTVVEYVRSRISKWQGEGRVPDSRIEPGEKTDEPIRTRGWTHWHHLFNPRQLLVCALIKEHAVGSQIPSVANFLNYNSKLCRWDSNPGPGRVGKSQGVFDNQALNTLYTYACRSFGWSKEFFSSDYKTFPTELGHIVKAESADQLSTDHDIFVTDPPYGDAVKYEEILEFFIAWLRKNPPAEFADWVWDSRRSMAIKGEDEDFRRGMVAAYKRMTECMPDYGIQVIMFTHQSGSIWADMANIVWASGLQVTAAWYVVTETESALRDGNNVKGTVLLVCRKRLGKHKTTRDELAWEIEEEVQSQVESLTGLNQQAKGLYRDENVFEDADIQMAGYAAALRVLTRYSTIDGRDMASESIRPRVKGEVTFVDDLIGYAVNTANQCLVPQGVSKSHWDKLSGAERFYLKMIDMEARGFNSIDNYQNFAKAFKVKNFQALMASQRAKSARLKSAVEFARAEMGEGSELHQSVLRAVLYGVMELTGDVETDDVLSHLTMNVPNWFGDMNGREMAKEFADYLAKRLEELRPEEAASARVLRDLIRNQRIG
ncbi:MAG TPA: DUF1156 domain-containing protein [Rhodopirellula baltica]|uniref:Probable predicted DNA methylase containing a Zn-ribbon n=1 Tax=Rhodopirellula baltica (strain DSM 10527 / NCIMB 13988 / SH1) TaxID=243090 RepID=Q7UYP9_RHOBA|nr:anti-phage-associated DUF1156 domain-containing protein [Rhodopirellula baltica]CAD71593.1 probable predicted DNA methylase containing a Zn-ribbon [Rhodopirellula baltica SH 1]HBE63363.1 DUF1156 domain-containing protein [Rhodopirellula baltica]